MPIRTDPYDVPGQRGGPASRQPCRPWPIPGIDGTKPEKPCGCRKSEPVQLPRNTPPESIVKKGCCEQIIEILRRMPGGEAIKIHKPKQSAKVKVANRCGSFPGVKDAAAPILMRFLRRFVDGAAPLNALEEDLQTYFRSLEQQELDALRDGLDAYEKLPAGLRECLFETRIDGCDDSDVLDPDFLLKVIVDEAIHVGRATVFSRPGGALGAGKLRPWEKTVPKRPDQPGPAGKLVGPWPWICQVNPGIVENKWYKNRDVTVPGNVPLGAFKFDAHEFGHVCDRRPDPNQPNLFTFDCHLAVPVAPEGMFVPDCENHPRYNYPWTTGTVCLAVPLAYPGQDVALRGLNFASLNCRVRLRPLAGGFQELVLDCAVMGDPDTPEMRDGQVVATCEVRDIITFTVPATVRAGLNDIPLPPGRWSVEVIVPNESGYAPTPGLAPSEFVSNDVWLDIQPPADQEYRLWTDEAFCIEETDGPGSDEPWFQAFMVKFVPSGTSLVTMFPQSQFTIMNTEDVDSGEWITFNAPDLFHGKVGRGEQVAITVLGLEVDDEDAARDQVRKFGEAYARYWAQFFGALGGAASAEIVRAIIEKALTVTALYVGLAVLAAYAIVGLFVAAWAPADPIGFDVMAFDALSLYSLTDPSAPPPSVRNEWYGITTLEATPRPKEPQPGGVSAKYSEDHVYFSRSENSRYRLTYKLERL